MSTAELIQSYQEEVARLRAQLAARDETIEEAMRYSERLALYLHGKFYRTPDFELLGELMGVLSQIDHMVAALTDTPPAGEQP